MRSMHAFGYAIMATTSLLLVALVSGCDAAAGPTRAPRQSAADFAIVRVPAATVSEVRPAAMQVFKQYFRLDNEASTGGVLRSRATETDEHGDREQTGVREVLSGRGNRRRQMAELHVIADGPGVVLRCQVQVQRLETVEREAFAPTRSGDDRPSEATPLGRSSSTEARTAHEWKNVGRDRQLEREILDQVRERIGASPDSRPAASGSSSQAITSRPTVP